MTEKCQVCGRTIEELQDQLNLDAGINSHQDIRKCEKCISEYNKACPNVQTEDAIPEELNIPEADGEAVQKSDKQKDWKERAVA